MLPSTIPNASGIYRIVCTVTGKPYIGSAINLRKRRIKHFHLLRNSTHHSITLQRAFDKYGEDAFIFEVIEFILPPFLLEREQYWLDLLLPFGESGYNIDRVAGSRLGHTPSAETREKLRVFNTGRKQSEETIRKLTESSTGRTHSPETKEAIRQIRLGTKRSAETCERLRVVHTGLKQSPETIEKRRTAMFGREVSEESRAKSSASNANAKPMKPLVAVSPDGTEYVVSRGLSAFCKAHNIASSNLTAVAKGRLKHTKGWAAHYI